MCRNMCPAPGPGHHTLHSTHLVRRDLSGLVIFQSDHFALSEMTDINWCCVHLKNSKKHKEHCRELGRSHLCWKLSWLMINDTSSHWSCAHWKLSEKILFSAPVRGVCKFFSLKLTDFELFLIKCTSALTDIYFSLQLVSGEHCVTCVTGLISYPQLKLTVCTSEWEKQSVPDPVHSHTACVEQWQWPCAQVPGHHRRRHVPSHISPVSTVQSRLHDTGQAQG